MLKLFGISCASVTLLMGLLHFLLLLGVPVGEYVLGGKNRIIPPKKRYINAIIFILFLFIGLIYFSVCSVVTVHFPKFISKVIMIAYSAFLFYAVIGNIFFTDSKKEKILMIPFSIIGFICSFFTLLLSW